MGAGGGVKMGVEECIHQRGLTYTCLSCKFVEWSILNSFSLYIKMVVFHFQNNKVFKREFQTETREKFLPRQRMLKQNPWATDLLTSWSGRLSKPT